MGKYSKEQKTNITLYTSLLLGLMALSSCAPAAPVEAKKIISTATATAATETHTLIPILTPTITPSETPIPTKTPTLTPKPSPTKTEIPRSFFRKVLSKFEDLVPEIRARKNSENIQRTTYINQELNKNRMNILVFGNGETYEPPALVRPGVRIGSFSVYSFYLNPNGKTDVDVVSISHDFHNIPVARRAFNSQNVINPDTRLSRTLELGGMKLMTQEIEKATGFEVDYAVAIPDTEIAYAIDTLFHGVDITPKTTVDTFPYYMNGKLLPGLSFVQSKSVHLTGREAIGTIKAVPIETSTGYNANAEHHARENWVTDGLIVTMLQTLATDREFPGRLQTYVTDRIAGNGYMELDFDPKLMQNAMDTFTNEAPGYVLHPWDLGVPMGVRSKIYIADERSSSAYGPSVKKCFGLRAGNGDMFVPYYGDILVKEDQIYWKSLRTCIGDSLSKLNQN